MTPITKSRRELEIHAMLKMKQAAMYLGQFGISQKNYEQGFHLDQRWGPTFSSQQVLVLDEHHARETEEDVSKAPKKFFLPFFCTFFECLVVSPTHAATFKSCLDSVSSIFWNSKAKREGSPVFCLTLFSLRQWMQRKICPEFPVTKRFWVWGRCFGQPPLQVCHHEDPP